jgi:hypothetical protein
VFGSAFAPPLAAAATAEAVPLSCFRHDSFVVALFFRLIYVGENELVRGPSLIKQLPLPKQARRSSKMVLFSQFNIKCC